MWVPPSIRTRSDIRRAPISVIRSGKRSPHALCSRLQSSARPPSFRAQVSGSTATGSGVPGHPVARIRTRILFHSIWKATSEGTRSSTSEAEAISTASVPVPLSYQRRRRATASACTQSSTGIPSAMSASVSCPITTSSAPGIPSGSRATAYRNAPRSSSSEAASACRLESIARWEGSSTRRWVSPLERRSVE